MGVVEFSADSWQASSPGLGKGLSRRVEVLGELAQGLEALAGSDRIGGAGADAMRAYIREVQVPVARSLLVAVSTFQTAIGVYWAGYAQVDTDGDFRLVRDEFDAHLTQLDSGLGRLRGFQDELTRISAGASHLVALGGAGAGAVGATVAEFEGMRAIARSQRETWEAYEASDPGFNQVRELIGELKGVLKNLGSLTVGRGRSYRAGSFDLTLARLGELTSGMVEYCQANQRAASDGWESMFSGYTADVAARAEAERREQAGWDLLWDGLQILAGAVIAVVGLGLTPFTGGFSLGLTVLGGSLLVGGVNNAINHASIATTGEEFNLVGMAGEAVGHWYDVNIAQSPLVKGSVGLQFLVGAGAAVGEMVAGGLQVNVKEIGQGVAVLATDADARARLVDGLADTWNQVLSGDAYVTGYAAATVASVLIPAAAAVKASKAGGLLGGAGKAEGLVPPAVKLSTPGAATSALPDLAISDGLTRELREHLMEMEKGNRPDPSTYLSPDYIEQHLQQFDDGATRFMTQTNFEKYGIGQRDGTAFVMPKGEVDALVRVTGGDPRSMEQALGLPVGFFDSGVIRVDIPISESEGLRMPSGNEAGANDQWIPGGKLPGGFSEGVIDVGGLGSNRYSRSKVSRLEDAQ